MAKKTKETEKVFFNLDAYEWEVENVRAFDFGTFFTLKLPGISLYNMHVVPAGKKYPAFIAAPQELGRDNKYYNQYALYLSDEDTEAVIEAVNEALEEKPKRKK